jgi:hypothetical protein
VLEILFVLTIGGLVVVSAYLQIRRNREEELKQLRAGQTHDFLPHPEVRVQTMGRIQTLMTPGESPQAICNFLCEASDTWVTVVVTNRHLVFLAPQETDEFSTDVSVPIRSITAITSSENDPKPYKLGVVKGSAEYLANKNKYFRLQIRWEGNHVALETPYAEGKHLAQELKRMSSAVQQGTATPTVADQLERLAQLTKEGILSADEWIRAKEMFLGRPVDKRDNAIRMLRSLHELYRTGALSQSEFNTKKWDILSSRGIESCAHGPLPSPATVSPGAACGGEGSTCCRRGRERSTLYRNNRSERHHAIEILH